MSKEKVFGKEHDFLRQAEAGGEDAPPYDIALKEYKKLLKQSERLVRMSDRQQLELIELNELKNKFVGMAAHDLRNPAGLVSGFSEVLLSDPDMPIDERMELLGIIKEVSENMLRLLGDLLDVSAIESGKLSLKTVEGQLDEMVGARVHLMSSIAEQKNISLLSALPPTTAFFDPDRLGQVVDNLISNAIKFSDSGTEITVSVREDGGTASFAVSDQGQGIPADELDKVFGTFQRLSVQPTGGEKSHGLGLAIAKKIVGAHNGTIDVTSKVGQGTTFTVRLPTP